MSRQLNMLETKPGATPRANRQETHRPPEPGTLCKIKGERGEFAFSSLSVSKAGKVSWWFIDRTRNQWRAFRPEVVTIIPPKRHRRHRSQPAAQ